MAPRDAARPSRARRVPPPAVLVRLLAAIAALTLLLVACDPGPPQAPEDDGTIVIEEEQPAPETTEPPAEVDPEPRPSEPPEQPPDETSAAETAPDEPPEPSDGAPDPDEAAPAALIRDDRGPLGSACRAYLRDDVPALAIEVLHQPGARPADDTVDHLRSSLEEVVDKPGGVEVVGPREIPGQGRTWTLDELRALAERHRGAHSTSSRATLLVLAVGGEYEQPDVLGLAMSATEIVLFPGQIGDLGTSLLGGSSRIERAVLLHEAGHLLCLVNIDYRSEIDHEDPDHPNHSRHRDSVMFWAVPNDAVSQAFTGAPPDRFHEDDLADLRGLRDGHH